MPKRLVGLFLAESTTGRILDLRQGLDPFPRLDITPGHVASGSGNSFAVSPDASYAVQGMGASPNMNIYADPLNLGSRTTPAVSFAGTVYACAASNTHYAFAGSSPFLYVFDKATNSLQTVSTTGLGGVNVVTFSPDGTKLAVCHTTAPYVRIYNVADWSFVNAGTNAGTQAYGACFSHDSSKLVVSSNASPYISVYNPTTGVRTYANTNVAYAASLLWQGGARMVRSPLDSNTIILGLQTSPFLGKFNTSSDTPSLFTAAVPGISQTTGLMVDPDPAEDAVYAIHGAGSTSPARTISKFRISTGVIYDPQPTLFRTILQSGTSPYGAGAIIATTPHTMVGTTRDVNNNPAARVIRAIKRSTRECVAETVSNATTGDYTLKLYDDGPYDIQFLTADGELLNDLFYARTQPQPV